MDAQWQAKMLVKRVVRCSEVVSMGFKRFHFGVSLWGFPMEFPRVSWRCPERVLRSCLTVPKE